MELNFFQLQNRDKISSTWKRNFSVLSRCACANLKIFLSAEKFLKWTPALKGTCKVRQCKKYRSNEQCTAQSLNKGVQWCYQFILMVCTQKYSAQYYYSSKFLLQILLTSCILKGTKYSYDRQKIVKLRKAFNYNQMLGYME